MPLSKPIKKGDSHTKDGTKKFTSPVKLIISDKPTEARIQRKTKAKDPRPAKGTA